MHYYISIEYCEGGEIFTKLAKLKNLSEEQASQIMLQILSAISYCHEKNVIHHDLKPDDILLEESNEVIHIKVADFGSSCILDSEKKLSGSFGSAYYIVPEVCFGSIMRTVISLCIFCSLENHLINKKISQILFGLLRSSLFSRTLEIARG